MQTLNLNDIEQIFKLAADSIDRSHLKRVTYLQDIKPLNHEVDNLTWRYRLEGYLHGMEANDAIDQKNKSKITQKLLGIRPVDKKPRPGRNFNYSINIFTEQGKKFSFNCPSMNPTDAYFQLTKRVAYKSIPDICLIEVFSGNINQRDESSTPVKVFPKNDLIYVSLI
jgi:hypothetical protein